jgi:hypothetical protein
MRSSFALQAFAAVSLDDWSYSVLSAAMIRFESRSRHSFPAAAVLACLGALFALAAGPGST